MKNKQGFSLIELVSAMAVSSIIILIIGVISTVANASYQNLCKEAEVYSQVYYGLNMIQSNVRKGRNVEVDTAQNTLTVDNYIFKKDNNDFVYIDTAHGNKRNVIVEGVYGLIFQPVVSGGNLVRVTLSGLKDKASFNLSISVMRRN